MSMSQSELLQFRHELRGAVAADLERHRVRRRHLRRAVTFGTPGSLLAALGLSLGLVLGTGAGISPADAAVLAGAESALSPPPNTVMHESAMVTLGADPAQPYELWATDSAFRVIKEGAEFAGNGSTTSGWSTTSSYDAATNTITTGIEQPQSHAPVDQPATIRSLIASGQAQVTGSTVVDGVPADVLSLTGLPVGSGLVNGTFDVAKSDYRPLLVQTTVACAQGQCPETVHILTYEYLPATAANLSLLDLSAQHPGAAVTSGAGTDGAPPSTGGAN
ncbi:MAG TPA: hypothetical protein VHZ02_04740 [Acidimicrobiales bacterium]|nr:hypothetical protein [Acidimicrobiales bacterium]